MTTRSRRDALALLVLTMYDKVVDYWASHGPRESKFGGSGVGDTIPQRGSTYEAHATAGKQSTRYSVKQERIRTRRMMYSTIHMKRRRVASRRSGLRTFLRMSLSDFCKTRTFGSGRVS